MSQIPQPLRDFARRLLRREADRTGDSGELAGALERACTALHERLAPLISSPGFQTLLGRAVKLASREFPFLATVSVAMDGNSCMEGLPTTVEGPGHEHVADALTAVLAHFIWLLVLFIGENLGLRKVREVWPEVPFDTMDSLSGTER